MIKKKINHTRFTICEGNPLIEETDVLVNWTVTSLLEGDEMFRKIHHEGGASVQKELLRHLSQPSVPMSHVVFTNSGILLTKKIIHAVIPNKRVQSEYQYRNQLINQTYQNIFSAIIEYSEQYEPIRRIVFTPIPSKVFGVVEKIHIIDFFKILMSNAEQLKLREVKVICDEHNYHLYRETFEKLTTTRWERFVEKIGFGL